MDNSQYALRKSDIYDMIASCRLFEALETMKSDVAAAAVPQLNSRFENVSQTLRYLTKFFVQGTPDPHRESMLGNIRADIVDLAEEVYTTLTFDSDTTRRMAALRMYRLSNRSLRSMLDDYSRAELEYSIMLETRNHESGIMHAREIGLKEIFDFVWSVPSISAGEAESLLSAVYGDRTDTTLALLVASALTLSLVQSPVSSKIRLLFNIYDRADNDRLAARAMTGIIVLLSRWGDMAVIHPEVKGKLEAWQDSPLAYCRVRDVVMAMLRAFDTKRVSKMLKEDVIPDLMKMQPDIQKMMKQAQEDSFDPTEGFDPEWEEKLEKSGLSEKLRKMSEIQEAGGDIMMNFIGSLKSHSFFRHVANWFAPFEIYRSELSEDTDILAKLFSVTDKAALFCDSDKYSLALAMRKFPAGIMGDQLMQQMKQANEDALDTLYETTPDFAAEVKNSVKGLYRFFRLSPVRTELEDIFREPVSPDKLPVIGGELFDDEFKRLISSFLFRNGYFGHAIPYLQALAKEDADISQDDSIVEQLGFCFQKLGQYKKALEYYDLSGRSSLWLSKNEALCAIEIGRYRDALHTLEHALETAPDDLELLHTAADVAFKAGKPDKALKHIRKAYFLNINPDDLPLIAWGEFLQGDYITSADYWRQAIEAGCTDPKWLLRAAYASMALSDVPTAVAALRTLSDKDRQTLTVPEEDLPHLAKAGIKDSDLQLLLQYLRFAPRP